MSQMPLLTFYTRPQCHLCDAARFVVERVARDLPLRIEYIDVSTDADLERRYGWHVPVVLIDGVEHARHRIDESALRHALESRT